MWQLQWEELEIEWPVGHGSFGAVYRARWQETTVAVKVLIDKGAHFASLFVAGCRKDGCSRRLGCMPHMQAAALSQLVCAAQKRSIVTPAFVADRMSHSSSLELPTELMRALDEEAAVMIRMRHPNVVQARAGNRQCCKSSYVLLPLPLGFATWGLHNALVLVSS